MNQHDSERIAGMLEEQGAMLAASIEQADIVVYVTCCVRQAADMRLLGQVASLKGLPTPTGGKRLIAVGGCLAQRDGEKLVEQLPHIDIVFGTHNIAMLPELIKSALDTSQPQVSTLSDVQADEMVPATSLPARRENKWHAWLPIMTGCNNFCSYCIVPYVRGRERSRPFEEILREVEMLLADGVVEITLLGQNVNSYGRDLYGQPRFAEILKAVGESGVDRLRFVTSHPKDLSVETIAAFAQTKAVMPHLQLPVQSGSDNILAAMNRLYTADDYRGLVHLVRQASMDAGKGGKTYLGSVAFSTDIIVGFPGETESDFQATCDLVEEIGFSQVFSFIYSRREGTPAASLVDENTPEQIQERYQRLVKIVQKSAWEQNQLELGIPTPVLFEGISKRDQTMLTGRSPKNTTVHAKLPPDRSISDYIGKIHPVRIDTAKTWYLSGDLLD
ncbi:MAG: tRNA (N6-isopentenyl adenosine(37)-C2)-methylthiotransferase MiaB [Coriobacteriia bacterium]|nr:tRNA (N6-isopentenyl adenosine(37)-C2)-methylthiotransferase MiaB [Coriobacteriia bacterium]